MARYLITHAKGQRGDMLIEDEALVLVLTERWARFNDSHGIVLALPVDQVAGIQRVDDEAEPEDEQPAPKDR